ncbi:MAG: ribonuclease P protein component [Sphingobacteriaceae bacterium]|nr:ribonuclease P protein component [Sphingobacteriaceae bacterium]
MNTFKKEERLCSKRLLAKLFSNGSSFLVYPFRIVSVPETLSVDFPAQVVIAVSKRNFKRAVDRNLIKRRVREAYRLNKAELLYPFLTEKNINLIISIHYIGKDIAEYLLIEKKLKQALKKLTEFYANEPA